MGKNKTIILTEEQLYKMINNEADKKSVWLYHSVLGSHNTHFKASANGDEFAALRHYGAIMPYDNGEIGIPVIWMTDDMSAYSDTNKHPERIVIAIPYNERTKEKFGIFQDGNYFATKPLPLDDNDVHIINAPAMLFKTNFGNFYYGCNRDVSNLIEQNSDFIQDVDKIVLYKDILMNLSNISEKALLMWQDKLDCDVEIVNLLSPDTKSNRIRDNYMFYATNDAQKAYDKEYSKAIPLVKELTLLKFGSEYSPILVDYNQSINFFFVYYGSMHSNNRLDAEKESVKEDCLYKLHESYNYDYDEKIEKFFNNLSTTDLHYIGDFLFSIGINYRELALENVQNKISEPIHFKGTSQDLRDKFNTCLIFPSDGSITNSIDVNFDFDFWFTNKDKQLKQKLGESLEKEDNIIYSSKFKHWFGDWENDNNCSQITSQLMPEKFGDNNEPLVVYHSTPYKFDNFEIGKHKMMGGDYAKGIYFCIANTQGYGRNVKECYLNVRKPYYVSHYRDIAQPSQEFIDKVKSYGYDGLIFDPWNSSEDSKSFAIDLFEIMVFDTEQIMIVPNQLQEARATLYTNTINKKDPTKRNRSPIQRCKYGVGKEIGGEIYIHKNYIDRIPQHLYEPALKILRSNPETQNFDFNLVVFPNKLDNAPIPYVKFINCTGFDTEREPLRGEGISVNISDGTIRKMIGNNTIYHHKWNWVDDDYMGFNVDDAYNWSAEWLAKLDQPANGTSLEGWNTQLDKYGLKHDKG